LIRIKNPIPGAVTWGLAPCDARRRARSKRLSNAPSDTRSKKYQSEQQRLFEYLLKLRDTELIADTKIPHTLRPSHAGYKGATVSGRVRAVSHWRAKEAWSKSGEQLDFTEPQMAELATITGFSDWDQHAIARKGGTWYTVQTVSLNDLLRHHGAPKTIDYLSIDTEGSELEILSAFDFSAYHVRIITVEHNHSPMRGKLHDLLTSNGFTRAFEEFSDWDDWYLKQGS
jgi:FkbM family methyltransferase